MLYFCVSYFDIMKEVTSYEQIKDDFTEYLVKHKHRKTPERYAILERIGSYQEHFNAEKLFSDMQENYRVSLATVYNTLEILIDAELVVKHQFGDQHAQYEKTFGNNTHHHLICTSCGKVKEFSDKNLRVAIQTKSFSQFKMSHYSLNLYGLCSKCQNK